MTPLAPIANDDERPITRSQADRLIALTERLAETNTWRRVAYVLLGLSLSALLVLSVSNILLYRQVSAQADCVRTYANENAARNNTLSPLSFAQLEAIARAFQSLRLEDKDARAEAFKKATDDELAAYQQYRQAFGDKPLPAAPGLNC